MSAFLLVILIVAGRWAWCAIGPAPRAGVPEAVPARPDFLSNESLLGLLAGFALSSVGIFLLAHFGCLFRGTIIAAVAAGAAASLLVCWKRGLLRRALSAWRQDVVLGVVLAALCVLLGALLPPIDTTLAASDSSVYLATARQLAREGTILHRDRLAAEMSAAERDLLFRNRFAGDSTGPHARFPGGVLLVDPSRDLVSFYFYHLFPAWLAAGLETVGDGSYLRLLALFGSVGLLSLFVIGRQVGGTPLALSLCLLHLLFFPQALYTRFPSSELLAQALFLSGLAAFLLGLGSAGPGRRAHVRLAALAWGAMCLCRVDAIPFLWLGLTAVSLLPARVGVRKEDWGVPILGSVLFAALAVYHQLANGVDYAGAFGAVGLPAAVRSIADGRTWPSLAVVVVLLVAGAILFGIDPARPAGRRSMALARLFGLVASAGILAGFLARLDWSLVARHAQWVSLYTTPLVLVALSLGVAAAIAETFRAGPPPALAVVLALFVGPAICYLVDPMVIARQPWAIRRFVPVIFPLFFVLALQGWQAGLRRVLHARPAFARAAFALLVVAVAAQFAAVSAPVFSQPARVNTSADVRSLDRAIPEGALVLVPDESASLHVQLALEYDCGRDVLLLPLGHDPEGRLAKTMAGFLERQLAGGRRVFLLLPGKKDVSDPLVRRFRIEPRFERTLRFQSVPLVREDRFPSPPVVSSVQVPVIELRVGETGAEARQAGAVR